MTTFHRLQCTLRKPRKLDRLLAGGYREYDEGEESTQTVAVSRTMKYLQDENHHEGSTSSPPLCEADGMSVVGPGMLIRFHVL